MGHSAMDPAFLERRPWNEGRVLGAKRALKQQQLWAIRFWLDQHRRLRDRALFNFAIDSKLRGCDVVKVRIGDVVSGGRVRDRAVVVQQKTKRPVQFELLDAARKTMHAWLERRGRPLNDYVFPSRNEYMGHLSTRQYARLVHESVTGIGLQPQEYGTHSLRRTKVDHLQGNGQPSRSANPSRPRQDREHRSLPRRLRNSSALSRVFEALPSDHYKGEDAQQRTEDVLEAFRLIGNDTSRAATTATSTR
jgi:integrase